MESNVTVVAESDPRKRKAHSPPEKPPDTVSKKRLGSDQLTAHHSTSDSVPVDTGFTNDTQLIRPPLNFSATVLRRTHIYFCTTPDTVNPPRPSMAGSEILIHIHESSVKLVLSSLYEAETQMRTSGLYEIDSVLGFLAAIIGAFV